MEYLSLSKELYLLNDQEWTTVKREDNIITERRYTDHKYGFLGQKLVQVRISKIIREDEDYFDTEELSLDTYIEDKKGNRISNINPDHAIGG